jgi:sigma-B regulation protein RsbQ
VLIGASPRFLNDGSYVGGYTQPEIDDLLEVIDSNISHTGPDLGRQFARAAFISDHRADLTMVTLPTLILHGSVDHVVPRAVGEYVARSIPGSRFELIARAGHFPDLAAPDGTAAAIHRFLRAGVTRVTVAP